VSFYPKGGNAAQECDAVSTRTKGRPLGGDGPPGCGFPVRTVGDPPAAPGMEIRIGGGKMAVSGRPAARRFKRNESVWHPGWRPRGHSPRNNWRSAGLDVLVFDEKLAWEALRRLV